MQRGGHRSATSEAGPRRERKLQQHSRQETASRARPRSATEARPPSSQNPRQPLRRVYSSTPLEPPPPSRAGSASSRTPTASASKPPKQLAAKARSRQESIRGKGDDRGSASAQRRSSSHQLSEDRPPWKDTQASTGSTAAASTSSSMKARDSQRHRTAIGAPCPFFAKGTCEWGDECKFSHGERFDQKVGAGSALKRSLSGRAEARGVRLRRARPPMQLPAAAQGAGSSSGSRAPAPPPPPQQSPPPWAPQPNRTAEERAPLQRVPQTKSESSEVRQQKESWRLRGFVPGKWNKRSKWNSQGKWNSQAQQHDKRYDGRPQKKLVKKERLKVNGKGTTRYSEKRKDAPNSDRTEKGKQEGESDKESKAHRPPSRGRVLASRQRSEPRLKSRSRSKSGGSAPSSPRFLVRRSASPVHDASSSDDDTFRGGKGSSVMEPGSAGSNIATAAVTARATDTTAPAVDSPAPVCEDEYQEQEEPPEAEAADAAAEPEAAPTKAAPVEAVVEATAAEEEAKAASAAALGESSATGLQSNRSADEPSNDIVDVRIHLGGKAKKVRHAAVTTVGTILQIYQAQRCTGPLVAKVKERGSAESCELGNELTLAQVSRQVQGAGVAPAGGLLDLHLEPDDWGGEANPQGHA